jgi:hypothetical protein
MIERTTVRLPSELLDRARRQAAAEGRTLTALIEDGLRLVTTRKSRARRVLPPVSTATGGMRPEFEGWSASQLEERDDLEYVERMKHLK